MMVILSSCTSADEAAEVRVGLGEQAHAAAIATAESARLDLMATATAHTIALDAQKTAVHVEVKATADAAPAIATAAFERRENKTAATNNATNALAWTMIFVVPLLGLALIVAAWKSTRRSGVIRVAPGELAIVNNWVVDGVSGSVRHLTRAAGQLPARTAVQITHAAAPALNAGMSGDWIEGVVGKTKEEEYEYNEEPAEIPANRQLGQHPG